MPTGIIPERKDADMKYELNSIISIKIRDNLFSLAQARENYLFDFFDISASDENWKEIDLNKTRSLFCIYVADNKMKGIFSAAKKNTSVIFSKTPTLRKMLNADIAMNQKYSDTVDLIQLTDSFSSLDAGIIKKNLLPQNDARDLCQYELTGMIGSKKYIVDRLNRHFTEGINWDIQKDFIFKGDLKPIKGINF